MATGDDPTERIPGHHDAHAEGGGRGADEGVARPTVPFDYVPAKSADAFELDMGDGVILYSRGLDLVHHLNFSAGLVWQCCDGDASVDALAHEIADAFGGDVVVVRDEVAAAVAELAALGLVVDASATAEAS